MFAAALAGVPADRRVPTCPDWTAMDLAHHLTQVQSFWTAVVNGPLLTKGQVHQGARARAREHPWAPD